jgi:hypothetical protein
VANEAAKCQKQQENALLAGQKQVGRMKNKEAFVLLEFAVDD